MNNFQGLVIAVRRGWRGEGERGCRDSPLSADGAPGLGGLGCTILVISFLVQCQLLGV